MTAQLDSGRFDLRAPGWSRDLPRALDGIRTIQFNSLPPESELEQLGALAADHPQIEFRVYGGYDGSIRDLDFLRFFENARRVAVDALYGLESIEGLRYLSPDLEQLVLGQTKRRFSVAVLERFTSLRTLYIEGHTKDIEVIGRLRELRGLTLRSITLPNLEIVRPLERLRSLDIKLGGTRDLRPLGEMSQLGYLELWQIRGFDDLSEVASLTGLRYLFLQALKQVTTLPDFSRCAQLERLHLETMKGLTDLRPINTAPALRDLVMVDMPQLRWEHVEPLQNHPVLATLRLGTGSQKRNDEYTSRLGFPPTPWGLSDDLSKLERGVVD